MTCLHRIKTFLKDRRILVGILLLTLASDLPVMAASAKLHIDVGLNHFYKKRYLEAFNEFKTAVEIDPRNAEARYNLARVYRLQGFFKEAVMELEMALTIEPKYAAARRELSEIRGLIQSDVTTRLKIEGQDEVLRQKVAEVGTNQAEQRAQAFLQKGDVTQAIVAFQEALKSDPYNGKITKMLGFLYYRQNKFADAVTWYEKAEKLVPNDAEVPYAIGLIYLKTGETERAVEDFQRAINVSPDLVKAQFGLGEAFEKLGRYEDAAFQYRKCLELNPNLEQAQERVRDMAARLGFTYFSRGQFYYQQGDYRKAEALLALARQYGSLTSPQHQQVEEMLTACKFWIGKQRAEEQVQTARQEVRSEAYINKSITVRDVVDNPSTYNGQAVEWEGKGVFEDSAKGRQRIFVNADVDLNADSNLDATFGIIFPKKLPDDARVSIFSKIFVKGKVIGVEKLLNTRRQVASTRRQPIVEASEVTFTRENYEQPLVVRFY